MKKLINQRMEWQRIELNCIVVRGFGFSARVRAYACLKKIEGGSQVGDISKLLP